MSAFSNAELAYFDVKPGLGRLATIGSDGLPHVVPLGWSYNAEHDTIDIGGLELAKTQKFRNVQADSRVAFVVDDVLPPWRPRAVMLRGHAAALEHSDTGDGGALIRLTPTEVVSWGVEER